MKKLFSFILLSALLLCLLGCHGKKDVNPVTVPTQFDENAKYEISFWAKNDTNVTQTEIYKKAIEDFTKLYSSITVNLRLYNDYGKIYNDVITNIATDTTPNVCITYPDHIATYLTGKDTVVPLDGLMDNEKYGLGGSALKFISPKKEEIIPKFLEEGKFSGKQYALPFMRSTEACYVNKTYVEALGFTLPDALTWDFIFEVSQKALEKDSDGNFLVNGQKVMIPFIYKSTDNMMIHQLYQRNIPYSDEDGSIHLFSDSTKNILLEVAPFAKSRAFSTFKISGYPANFLNAGQCIFAVDSTAGATWMGCDAPLIDISEDNLVRFETVVMPLPQYDIENPRMISQGPSVCLFNKEDKGEVMASWLFLQYLLTNEVQIAYSSTEGYVPVTSLAQNSETYKDYLNSSGKDNDMYYSIKLDASKLLLENTDKTFVTPVFNGSASLRNAAGQLIEETVKASRRGTKVDDSFIEKLFGDMKSLYRLDELSPSQDGKKDLGPLPAEARVLIAVLGTVWIFMGIYSVISRKKKRK